MNSKLFLSTAAITVMLFVTFSVLLTDNNLIFRFMALLPAWCICHVWYHAGKAVGRSEQIETERKLNKLRNE